MMVVNLLFIDNFKAFNNFEITFNKNLSVIIGENGTGKTTILEVIFNMLSGNASYFDVDEKFTMAKLEFDINTEHYILEYKTSHQILLNNNEITSENIKNKFSVIYLPTESTFKDKKLDGIKSLEEIGYNIILDSESMSNRLKQFLLNQYFKDLSDIQKGIQKEAGRIEKFKKLYNDFFIDKEFIEINPDTFEPIFKDKQSNKYLTVKDLSAGEKQIFFRGGSLLENVGDDSIVLIDEPEVSLHPEWQQRILDFYKNINANSQYIFSTHSPHIVSCCKKEELIVLYKNNGGKIEIKHEIENPYALPTDLMLLSIFNLSTVRNKKVEKIIDRYKELSSQEKLLDENGKKQLEEARIQMESVVNPNDTEIKYLEKEPDTKELEQILMELGGSIDA